MHYIIPDGSSYGQVQAQPSQSVDDSLFTISASRRIVKATTRDSLLVLADDAGQVTLVRFDGILKGKGRAPTFSRLAEGGEVHAMEVCTTEEKQWIVLARSIKRASLLEVYDADSGQLYATLPPLHRTPPHSLVASILNSTLASISSSEVLLFNFSADWSCTWALRGPSPRTSAPSSSLSTALWINSTNDSSTELASSETDDLLTIWDSGEICLWTSPPPSRASSKPMKLVWRISPPSTSSTLPSRPTATCSASGLLYTTSRTGGKTDVLVWDVEDRSLAQQVSLELETVESLHVLEEGDGDSVLLVHSGRCLYSLILGVNSRRPSLRLLHDCVDAVVGVSEGRIKVLVDGELCDLRASTLLKAASSTTEVSPPSASRGCISSLAPHAGELAFDPSWLETVSATRLQRIDALRRYLEVKGLFPSAHRSSIYATLLRCPSSSKYFTLLATPEDTTTMDAFRAEWELADWRAQARMESIIHLLRSHGFPTSALVDSIPPCIYGLLVTLAASTHPPTDQELFEISLTVLLRWARVLWDDSWREAKGDLWSLAEEVLEREGTSASSLREKGVSVARILANVAHGLVNGVLGMADWIVVLDHIVARSPLFFVCLLGALVDHHQEEVDSLGALETMDFFRHSHPVSTEELVREAEGLYLDASYQLVCP
ncbi:hypothetical protein BCR35DRAFT_355865 [Leucosporidium creatinivorum]|uniref:Uncharacterized protein n=1 Tax=Leucosporidium creatinivorum TaxID=106004 RepID=A0A1Y2D5N3_9BASI|nr:hypothetical protein BCR35DRAFT_355865 [Leucosporidium creatinivorum]